MYFAHPDRFAAIPEIAAAFGISANHLMKLVQRLAASGYVLTLRGSSGGLRLARPAETIRVEASVVSQFEYSPMPSGSRGTRSCDMAVSSDAAYGLRYGERFSRLVEVVFAS
jgi:Rrf2 family protein